MTMTTEAAPSGWGSTLESKLEMIAIAHGFWNKRQEKLSSNNREIKAITQGLRSFAKTLKNSRVKSLAIRSDNSTTGNQTDALNNRKARNLDPDYSPPRSQKRDSRRTKRTIKGKRLQTKGEDFSTDMSSVELELNIGLIFTTLQQSTAKIHVNNKKTRRNCNRCSQSNKEEGTAMNSSSYLPPSSSSEEDQRRADRSNDNSSTIAGPDMVHRTGKRECSILYVWLEQRSSGIKNIINQEEFETPSRKDMLLSDGLKARKGRIFTRKILRIPNVLKGAIYMILYGQRCNTQRRYYYAIEKLKKLTQINFYAILYLLTMKPHIIITEPKSKEYLQDTQQFSNKLTKQIYDYNRKRSLDFIHINFRKQETELENKYGGLWWNEDITIPAKRGQISFRLKKFIDLMGIKGKQVYSFRHSAATQLVVMGLEKTLLNTYTGHARNSKSTNEYYVFAERLKDNEIATKLSDTRGQVECNSISSTEQR
ncbi:MAG: hypothetical protein EZS28_015995 [Streblomastix strix]|uniref:Tyr recombinase domain-containing protein n=1 Tax=Streblomastix strix TaxID=222440 RepID=A0A5J4W1G2_9EUKA|nr:MAG: hypothetical protein EZS28_015995 [Streblomastix strix]